MYRVVHFNIMADDMARAVKFYGDVFGWRVMCIDTEGNTFGLFEEDPKAK